MWRILHNILCSRQMFQKIHEKFENHEKELNSIIFLKRIKACEGSLYKYKKIHFFKGGYPWHTKNHTITLMKMKIHFG